MPCTVLPELRLPQPGFEKFSRISKTAKEEEEEKGDFQAHYIGVFQLEFVTTAIRIEMPPKFESAISLKSFLR